MDDGRRRDQHSLSNKRNVAGSHPGKLRNENRFGQIFLSPACPAPETAQDFQILDRASIVTVCLR